MVSDGMEPETRQLTTYKQFDDFHIIEQIIEYSGFKIEQYQEMPKLPPLDYDTMSKKSPTELQYELEEYLK